MATNGANLQDTWLSFVESNQPDALDELVKAYPDERSIYVDVLDLHQQAPQVAKELFSNPDRVLHTASNAIIGTHDDLDRVNVRLENHPGLLQLSSVRVRHLGELVTLEGVVDEVGPVTARADRAAFTCQACGAKVGRQTRCLELDPPETCQECGNRGPFDFLPNRSTYVDCQRVVLREPSEAFADRSEPRRFDVYLDDDLVETVEANDAILATGVVRLHRDGDGNHFSYYLDVNAVTDEEGPIADEDVETDELQDVIESHWTGLVEE